MAYIRKAGQTFLIGKGIIHCRQEGMIFQDMEDRRR